MTLTLSPGCIRFSMVYPVDELIIQNYKKEGKQFTKKESVDQK